MTSAKPQWLASFPLTKPTNWLIFALINPELEKRFARYAKGRLLDIGCGIKPYQEALKGRVIEHVGLDHADSLHAADQRDLVGTAYEIPAPDRSFDAVLCTDVLEHLEEPGLALAEAFRVLKPGGYGIYTVPFFWHLHETPRDFYRYTEYGLQHMFRTAGFDVIEVAPLSGYWAMMGQMTAYYFASGSRRRWYNPVKWLTRGMAQIAQYAGWFLNKFDNSQKFTIEYLAVVQRPED